MRTTTHLALTLAAMFGGGLQPGLFGRPPKPKPQVPDGPPPEPLYDVQAYQKTQREAAKAARRKRR